MRSARARAPQRVATAPCAPDDDLFLHHLLVCAGLEQASRVRPLFANERYGTPWYAQLADRGAEEIRRGADDGAELGAFHDLYRPQREDGMRARLAEYTPAGTDAGIFFVT